MCLACAESEQTNYYWQLTTDNAFIHHFVD